MCLFESGQGWFRLAVQPASVPPTAYGSCCPVHTQPTHSLHTRGAAPCRQTLCDFYTNRGAGLRGHIYPYFSSLRIEGLTGKDKNRR